MPGLEEGRLWTKDAFSSVEMVRFLFVFPFSLSKSHMSCSYSLATAARVCVLRQPEVVGPEAEAGRRWSGLVEAGQPQAGGGRSQSGGRPAEGVVGAAGGGRALGGGRPSGGVVGGGVEVVGPCGGRPPSSRRWSGPRRRPTTPPGWPELIGLLVEAGRPEVVGPLVGP